ncbi:Phosphoenolpyruvate-dihydroxyacetone phosphotransferase, subunit DhaM [Alkalibacterium sp. AK22]|uniref:dihydroxyacetone kinase phosphoryl donor subunit DhaM n=1 Tax=Alkalibacterium sp. AK22 TaxID=1229520 RepID=UPI0004527B91|nr:dihydroxyacetone kinase phosphoryl donor subunit DhaM [Alkalibacterium sp. AK22]EXJ23479.1 Phosphoenolpyruvate-dihydroxyacetone phosphotransferase, subunit DhaM [Alkalibacterium sp. AK22]
MNKQAALLLVSHVEGIAEGLKELLIQVATDVTIITAGGLDDGSVGTSFDRISAAITDCESNTIWCFYDLGSAKMNLEIAAETTDKEVMILDAAFVEGAYTAASLLQAEVKLDEIMQQLSPLMVKN